MQYRDRNNANYDPWPDADKTSGGYGKGYNSNSFISGLLEAAGISPITPLHNVPGFDKPLSRGFFGQ